MSTRTFSFIGGDTGVWRVVNTEVIVGQALPGNKWGQMKLYGAVLHPELDKFHLTPLLCTQNWISFICPHFYVTPLLCASDIKCSDKRIFTNRVAIN